MVHFGLRLGCWQRDCSATNGGPPELDHSNKGTGSSIRVDALPARQIRAGRVWKRAALLVLTSQWANIARSAFPFIRIRLICRRSC